MYWFTRPPLADKNQIAITDITEQLRELYILAFGSEENPHSILGVSTKDNPKWEEIYYNLLPKVNDSIIKVGHEYTLLLLLLFNVA